MEPQAIINQFIHTQLIADRGAVQLGPDDNLLLSGLIDSHGVMRLVKFIEDQFAITVNPGEVTLKNFKTVNAMTSFISRKTAVTS